MKNSVFNKSINQFNINKQSYQKLSYYIRKLYPISEEDINNQIVKDIYNIYKSGVSGSYFNRKLTIKDYAYTILFYMYLIFSLPVSFIYYSFKKRMKFDVVYEEIWPGNYSTYKRFYSYIDNFLDGSKTSLLISPVYKAWKKVDMKDEYLTKQLIDRRFSNYIFHYSDILRLLKTDIFTIFSLFQESKRSNVNLVIMYLRIIRRILFYKAQTYKTSATVLVGANDYYWNPIKYFIFKNNGFKNIILLQHNSKHHINENSLYIYCDIYFADSKDALLKSEYIIAKEKFAIGSIQLTPFLDNKQKKKEYDIFVVHHPIKTGRYDKNGLDKDAIFRMYEVFLDYLMIFSKKFPDISILYISKNYNDNDNEILYYQEINNRFKEFKNIDCKAVYGKDTYSLLNNSKVLINFFSSLGFQAYGFDSRVMWINFDNILDSLDLPNTKEDIDTLLEPNYEHFEEKLLNLLLNDSEDMKIFMENKKQQYMNIQENPAKVVADKINEILAEEDVKK